MLCYESTMRCMHVCISGRHVDKYHLSYTVGPTAHVQTINVVVLYTNFSATFSSFINTSCKLQWALAIPSWTDVYTFSLTPKHSGALRSLLVFCDHKLSVNKRQPRKQHYRSTIRLPDMCQLVPDMCTTRHVPTYTEQRRSPQFGSFGWDPKKLIKCTLRRHELFATANFHVISTFPTELHMQATPSHYTNS
jgi:hypothetical protein